MILTETLKKYRWVLAGILSGMIAANVLTFSLPWALKVIIDNHGFSQNVSRLWAIVLFLGIAIILKVCLQWTVRQRTAAIAEQMAYDLSLRVYTHALKQSILDIRRQKPSQIISYLNSDIETLRRFGITEIAESVYSALSIFAAVLLLMCMNGRLMGLALTAVILSVVFLMRILPRLKQNFLRLKEMQSRTMVRSLEVLTASAVVKALDTSAYEQEFFARNQQNIMKGSLKNYALSGALTGGTDLFLGMALVGILCLGGLRMEAWHLTAGTLAAFYSYTIMLFGPILRLGNTGSSLQQARASWDRIMEFLNSSVKEHFPSILVEPFSLGGPLRADGLFYHYPGGAMVIEEVSLSIRSGETLGVVGPSGAGKTTLVYLLTGLLNPVKGAVRLGGWDLKVLDRRLLARHISVVFQDDHVFSGTVMDNIRYGSFEVSDEQIYDAARASGAADFIGSFKEGYQTSLSERGLNLSGGQRQRIALARALVRRPKILILDEATCALDALTENFVQDSIRHFCPDAAIITIAHRFSTIMDADRIVVIEAGRIAEQGDHNYLLSRQGLYSTLYWEQFKNT